MQTGKILLCWLALAAATMLAQDAPPMQMPMPPASPAAPPAQTAHSSPSLLQGITARPPRKLEDFIAAADRTNPALRQADAMIHRSESQAKQAALYPNPTVGYEGDQIRGGSYGGGEQGGFVAQTIVLGGKLGLRRDIYQQQSHADTAAADVQRQRVHNDVTQMFYKALSAQQTVMVRGRLLALANDAVETAHQLANIGQADEPGLLQAEVEAEQADIDYTVAQQLFIQKFKQLAILSGQPAMEIAPLDAAFDAMPELDADALARAIVQQSPLVKQAQQQVLVAEARLKDARREVVPDLQLRAGEQANLEALPAAPARKTGAQSFAGAGIELPLWNRNQGNIRAAEIELEQARQEVVRTQLSAGEQATALAAGYASARMQADRYRTGLLPRARRAYSLYLAKYQQMAQAYSQVIVSQRTLFNLELRYIDALDRVWQNAIALQNYGLQGGLDPQMERPLATP